MRDKKDATEFVRKVDRCHPINTRVLLPPVVDQFLRTPDKVIFILDKPNNRIILKRKNASDK